MSKGHFTITSTYLWLLDITGYFVSHSLSLLEYESELEFKHFFFNSLFIPSNCSTFLLLLISRFVVARSG